MSYRKYNGNDVIGLMPNDFLKEIEIDFCEIKFPNGIEGPKGYGYLHVNGYSSRIHQIKGLGYQGVLQYAYEVCSNYSVIRKNENNDSSHQGIRYLLGMTSPGYEHVVVVTFNATSNLWEITTAIPGRRRKETVVWKRSEILEDAGESEPTPEEPRKLCRFTTLSLPQKRS